MEKTFDIGEVFSFGWKCYRGRWLFFSSYALVVLLLMSASSAVSSFFGKSGVEALLGTVVMFILSNFFSLSFMNVSLKAALGETASFKDLFSAATLFPAFLIGTILYILTLTAGILLLVFPAFIWAMQFSLFYFYIINKKMGPVASLEASSEATYGFKWRLFGFFILSYLLNVLGFLCLGVGFLVTWPLTSLAHARIYVKLR